MHNGGIMYSISVTWRILAEDLNHTCVWHDSFVFALWLIHNGSITFSISVTWRILAEDLTHTCVWHDVFVREPSLIHVCDVSVPYVISSTGLSPPPSLSLSLSLSLFHTHTQQRKTACTQIQRQIWCLKSRKIQMYMHAVFLRYLCVQKVWRKNLATNLNNFGWPWGIGFHEDERSFLNETYQKVVVFFKGDLAILEGVY